MKLGDSIREIREVEKNFKRKYVAQRLGISTRAYGNIENNISDITLNRLEEIAGILECTAQYILNYKRIKTFYSANIKSNNVTQFNYRSGDEATPRVELLLRELLQCERKRINLLEALLRVNNIEF
ncbi:MAG: helix-turn-helix transcriptional regulator [Arachidicoccus sp.]|nr:helix-turn-helix transcriptional regulator [Arachidicoccus sp.]